MNEFNLPSNGDLPATYEIRVRGKLDPSWSTWFDSMILTDSTDQNDRWVTTLTGVIPDQAAMYGLLSKFRDMGLTILSMAQVDPKLDS